MNHGLYCPLIIFTSLFYNTLLNIFIYSIRQLHTY